MNQPSFDVAAAHRFFAANCFNRAWELIDRAERTADEDEAMIRLSHASLWHWTQRPDCTAQNLSIAYWQLARVYVLAKQPATAQQFAERCLAVSGDEGPFCLAFAHEALARAASLAGDAEQTQSHLAAARELAESITDAEDKQRVLKDLDSIS